jgi:hypothetical protein
MTKQGTAAADAAACVTESVDVQMRAGLEERPGPWTKGGAKAVANPVESAYSWCGAIDDGVARGSTRLQQVRETNRSMSS